MPGKANCVANRQKRNKSKVGSKTSWLKENVFRINVVEGKEISYRDQ